MSGFNWEERIDSLNALDLCPDTDLLTRTTATGVPEDSIDRDDVLLANFLVRDSDPELSARALSDQRTDIVIGGGGVY
ncbi:MAG: hypothetical protein ACJ789_09615 [Thermomicrobiales bacterium]